MQMHCNSSDSKSCKKSCHSSDLKIKLSLLNSNFQKRIIKEKVFSFVNIFSNNSSNFLENKNLIKNTSPPNIENKIKYYFY